MTNVHPQLFDPPQHSEQRRQTQAKTLQAHALWQEVQRQIDERLGDIKRDFTAQITWPIEATGTQHQKHDLITSCLALQHESDLGSALADIHDRLAPDGLFLGALIGDKSLHELSKCLMEAEIAITGGASPRVSPMFEKKDVGNLLLRAGFKLPVLDHQRIHLAYPDLWALMRDLRAAGCANNLTVRTRHFTRRVLFEKANKLYSARFPAKGGGILVTIDLLYLHGWKAA